MKRSAWFVFPLAAAAVLTVRASQVPAVDLTQIDSVFARWTTNTPGCSVGASVKGRVVVNKAYGMADLEHDVPNAADTIFEAGSVSKQFTAAAMLLLARAGKISFDDPVRKYKPEALARSHSAAMALARSRHCLSARRACSISPLRSVRTPDYRNERTDFRIRISSCPVTTMSRSGPIRS